MFARSLRSFDGGFKGATREPKASPAAFPDATDMLPLPWANA